MSKRTMNTEGIDTKGPKRFSIIGIGSIVKVKGLKGLIIKISSSKCIVEILNSKRRIKVPFNVLFEDSGLAIIQ